MISTELEVPQNDGSYHQIATPNGQAIGTKKLKGMYINTSSHE